MKQYLNTLVGVIALSAGSISTAAAADYANLSNDEMVQMRSQVQEAAPEDRRDYRAEMQSRVQ